MSKRITVGGQSFSIEAGAWVNGELGREWDNERETVYGTRPDGAETRLGAIAAGDTAHAERIARFYVESGLLDG
jgi:hypothetical protein